MSKPGTSMCYLVYYMESLHPVNISVTCSMMTSYFLMNMFHLKIIELDIKLENPYLVEEHAQRKKYIS